MKNNYYKQIINILLELKEIFPSYNLGRHIETALDEYKDVWGITDKELHWALVKYKAQLTMDSSHTDGSEIDKIIREGMNLNTILQEDEEDD